MNQLLSTAFPEPKTISPASMSKPTVENVPSGNYLNRVLNYAKAPSHARSADLDYCTTLPPSPKDHLTHNPTCTKGVKFPNRPFKRGECYMLYSPQQNIWGPVCGSAEQGGSNSNWVRGNRFGVNYEYDKIFKRDDYAVDVPRFNKKNPVLVSDSPYYPFQDYPLRFNPKYKSYPYENNYIKGKPTISYPYSTLDNPTKTVVVEGFSNKEYTNWWVMIMLIIIILFFCNLYYR